MKTDMATEPSRSLADKEVVRRVSFDYRGEKLEEIVVILSSKEITVNGYTVDTNGNKIPKTVTYDRLRCKILWCMYPYEDSVVNGCQNYLYHVERNLTRRDFEDNDAASFVEAARGKIAELYDKYNPLVAEKTV